MTDVPGARWPAYSTTTDEHMKALGVASANFNMLELALKFLFTKYVCKDTNTSDYLFVHLQNNMRIDLLCKSVVTQEPDEKLRDQILHFCKCLKLAIENRNFLMHSLIVDVPGREHSPYFLKATKSSPSGMNTLNLTVEEIREVADYMHELNSYGLFLNHYGTLNVPPFNGPLVDTWLKIPALPRKIYQPRPKVPRQQKARQKPSKG